MSDMEKEAIETMKRIIPKLSDVGKAKLIGYGDGLNDLLGVTEGAKTDKEATA